MVVEAKAIATKVMVGVAKEEAAHAVMRYKALKEFEDEVSKAVCDALYKGFEESKKKVA